MKTYGFEQLMVCPKWETCTAEDCPDRTPHPRNGYCKPSSCTCSEEKIACIPYVAEVKKSCETCGQTECPDMTPCKAMDGGYHNWIPKSDFTQKHTDMRRDYPLPNQLTPPVESQPAEPQMMVCEFALTCNDKHKTTCFPHRRARSAVAAMCERTSRTCNYIPYIPDTGKSVSEVTEVAVGEFQPAKPKSDKLWLGNDGLLFPDTFDAQVWAKEFLKHSHEQHDEATIIGWFANAIMRGYDTAHQEQFKKGKIVESKPERKPAGPRPRKVSEGMMIIVNHRYGICAGCQWHPDVCYHCQSSEWENGEVK